MGDTSGKYALRFVQSIPSGQVSIPLEKLKQQAEKGFNASSMRFQQERQKLLERLTEQYSNLTYDPKHSQRKDRSFTEGGNTLSKVPPPTTLTQQLTKFSIPKKATNFHYLIPQHRAGLIQLAEKYYNQEYTPQSAFQAKQKKQRVSRHFRALSNPQQLQNFLGDKDDAEGSQQQTQNRNESYSLHSTRPEEVHRQSSTAGQSVNNAQNHLEAEIFKKYLDDHSPRKASDTVAANAPETVAFASVGKNSKGHQSSFKTTSRDFLQKYETRLKQVPGPGQYENYRQFEINKKSKARLFYKKKKSLSTLPKPERQEGNLSAVKKKIVQIIGQKTRDGFVADAALDYSSYFYEDEGDDQLEEEGRDQQQQQEAEMHVFRHKIGAQEYYSMQEEEVGGGTLQGGSSKMLVRATKGVSPRQQRTKGAGGAGLPSTQQQQLQTKNQHMFMRDDRDRFGQQIFPLATRDRVPPPGHYQTNHFTLEKKIMNIRQQEEQKKLLKIWLHPNSHDVQQI